MHAPPRTHTPAHRHAHPPDCPRPSYPNPCPSPEPPPLLIRSPQRTPLQVAARGCRCGASARGQREARLRPCPEGRGGRVVAVGQLGCRPGGGEGGRQGGGTPAAGHGGVGDDGGAAANQPAERRRVLRAWRCGATALVVVLTGHLAMRSDIPAQGHSGARCPRAVLSYARSHTRVFRSGRMRGGGGGWPGWLLALA